MENKMSEIEENIMEIEKYILENPNTSFKVECINKAVTWALKIGETYPVIRHIPQYNYLTIFNDNNEVANYGIKYFKLIKDCKIKNLIECKKCNHKLISNVTKNIEGDNYCIWCIETYSRRCHGNNCKIFTMNFDNFKKINDNYFCKNCLQKLQKTIIECSLCENQFFSAENKKYGGFGNLCPKCYMSHEDTNYENILPNDNADTRIITLSSKGNSFKEFPDRTFGVEFEVEASKDYLKPTIIKLIKEMNTIPITFKTTLLDYFKFKRDGSLDSKRGVEIITHVLKGDKGKEIIEKMCELLQKSFETSNRCGLHIHIGVNDFTDGELKDVYYIYQHIEPLLKYYVNPSRIKNRYCKKLLKRPKNIMLEILRNKKRISLGKNGYLEKENSYRSLLNEDYELDRYCAINFMSINEHNTLDRKSTRLNSSHVSESRMPSSA